MSIDKESVDRLVLWSPSLLDRNGQNIVTDLVLKNFKFEEVFCYTGGGRLSDIAISILTSARLIWFLWREHRQRTLVYAVISRSFLGVLRDLPIYFFANASKFVLHIHGAELMQGRVLRVISCLISILSRRATCTILVPSERVGAEIKRKCKSAVVKVVENPCTINFSVSEGQIKSKSKARLLWNSNLMEEKGYLDFLEVIEKSNLSDRGDMEIVVCGRILGSASFKRQVEKKHRVLLGAGAFFYRGAIDGSKIRQELLRATHVVLPTKYRTECQPLSLIEAMCCGRALIVSSLPAVVETIRDYPAYQFKPGDIYDFERVVAEALSDHSKTHSEVNCPTLADSENARKRFGVDQFLSNMRSALVLSE